MSRAIRNLTIVVVTMLLSTTTFAQSSSSTMTDFHLDAQPLVDALPAWAQQAGLQLIWPTDDRSVMEVSPRVVGSFPAKEALRLLLTGTGIEYSFVDDYTVVIHPRPRMVKRVSLLDEASSSITAGQAAPNARLDRVSSGPTAESIEGNSQARPENIAEVIVTGSHIRGGGPVGSVVTTITHDDLRRSGVSSLDQFIKKLPSNFSLVDGETFNNGGGAAAHDNNTRGSGINLRGLGTTSTLVLINGHRVASSGASGSFVDVSMIPMSAIERIEILPDGASAVYGSDAVAGVVNFILRDDYDGAETGVNYGLATEGGMRDWSISQLLGTSWTGGHALGAYEFFDQSALDARDRPFVPDQGGGFDLVPSARRHSVFVTGDQRFTSSTRVSAEGMYSTRDFIQNTVDQAVLYLEHGTATQYGGTVSLLHEFSRGALGELSVSSARADEERLGTIDGVPFDLTTRSVVQSVDFKFDGTLLSGPAGDVRAAIGTGIRREEFTTDADEVLQRDIATAFGEIIIPVIAAANRRPLVSKLDLSLAGRYDRYDDAGSSFNPHFGIAWVPAPGISFRGSYGTSFRAPLLPNMAPPSPRQYYLLPIPDPSSASGDTVTLVPASPETTKLQPEKSRSFTLGVEIEPERFQGFSASATYFDIRFRDRIAVPPQVGTAFNIYQPINIGVLSPFIHRNPGAAQITTIFDTQQVIDLFEIGLGADDVQVLYDLTYQNIGKTRVSGVDWNLQQALDTRIGRFSMYVTGDFFFDLSSQPTGQSETAQLLNRIYNPMDLRLRGGLTWSRGSFESTLMVNYSDGYENNLVDPVGRVASWVTLDAQLAWRAKNFDLGISVQNIADADPPRVPSKGDGLGSSLGFDATASSPRGRYIRLAASRKFAN